MMMDGGSERGTEWNLEMLSHIKMEYLKGDKFHWSFSSFATDAENSFIITIRYWNFCGIMIKIIWFWKLYYTQDRLDFARLDIFTSIWSSALWTPDILLRNIELTNYVKSVSIMIVCDYLQQWAVMTGLDCNNTCYSYSYSFIMYKTQTDSPEPTWNFEYFWGRGQNSKKKLFTEELFFAICTFNIFLNLSFLRFRCDSISRIEPHKSGFFSK